jgi:hypothetical protein
MMASLDALNEARLAAKAATTAPTPTTPTKVNTTTLAGIAAASNPPAPAGSVAATSPAAPAPAATDPLKNKAVQPSAPAGSHYTWIGGTTTGSWQLYKDPGAPAGPSGGGVTGGSGVTGTTGPTTATADLVAKQNADALAAAGKADRQSAFDTLYNEFNKYGLGSMVDQIKGLITDSNVNPSQFAIALQNTDAYKKRFSANQDRIAQGLRALTPAEYIGLEDQYQNIMRNYGMPASYYTKDSMGTQSGFNKFIANDVSATELENRIATAQQRVINSNPEVLKALKQFYPDISNGDILAYTLDPKNGLDTINRKVTAAEIGGAALAQGLQANGGTAESLAGQGITKAQAQQGYTNVAEMTPRGSQLADIYGQTPYTQGTAEAEVFNTAGAAAATAKRKKLTGLETAAFSGSSGVGSLNRDRPISNYMLGQPGAGAY